jgi:hypothetical protein
MGWHKFEQFPGTMFVDEFIQGAQHQKLDVTLMALIDHFERGKIMGSDGVGEVDHPFFKSNRVFRSVRGGSAPFESEIGPMIREAFEALIMDPEVVRTLIALHGSGVGDQKRLRVDEIQISAYGNGDFYTAHFDEGGTSKITINLLWCVGDQKFTGGSLKFHDADQEDCEAEVEFKKNRLVVFPCRTLHQVTRVELDDNRYQTKRFSIQAWSEWVDV